MIHSVRGTPNFGIIAKHSTENRFTKSLEALVILCNKDTQIKECNCKCQLILFQRSLTGLLHCKYHIFSVYETYTDGIFHKI